MASSGTKLKQKFAKLAPTVCSFKNKLRTFLFSSALFILIILHLVKEHRMRDERGSSYEGSTIRSAGNLRMFLFEWENCMIYITVNTEKRFTSSVSHTHTLPRCGQRDCCTLLCKEKVKLSDFHWISFHFFRQVYFMTFLLFLLYDWGSLVSE